jgi:CD2 antigen cytoplasmic tail-binding protein 2
VKVDPSLAQRAAEEQAAADGVEEEMSTGEMAAIKRRIADTLEGGETVLQGLRRLGGQGGNRQGGRGRGRGASGEKKMSDEEKRRFDALTEDASRLMEAGEYSEWGQRWGVEIGRVGLCCSTGCRYRVLGQCPALLTVR